MLLVDYKQNLNLDYAKPINFTPVKVFNSFNVLYNK